MAPEISQIPTRPIRDDELQGCTIPVFILSDLRDAINEMKADLTAERHERRRSELLIADLIGLLTDIDDEGKRRMALMKARRLLERREAEYSLPNYFWRPGNGNTEDMIRDRAKYLIYEARAGIRDIWAFLVEFNDEYSGNPIPNESLSRIIQEVKNAPTAS